MKFTKYIIATLVVCQSISLWAQDNTNTAGSTDSERHGLRKGGLFIEPFLSVSKEESTIRTSQLPIIADDTSGNTDGVGVGLRLGFHVSEIIFIGADARYERTRFTDSAYGTSDGSSYNIGPTIGVQMPRFGLRFWGGYIGLGESDPAAGNSGFDAKFKDAKGTRLGAGIRIAALSLNIETQDLKYDNTDIQSYGVINRTGESTVDYDGRATTISVSFPMEL